MTDKENSEYWENEFNKLKIEFLKLKIENQNLIEEIQYLKNEINKKSIKIHNERGAGRHKIFNNEEKAKIRKYRSDGKTIKQLSELFDCSIGLIHKIINENE